MNRFKTVISNFLTERMPIKEGPFASSNGNRVGYTSRDPLNQRRLLRVRSGDSNGGYVGGSGLSIS